LNKKTNKLDSKNTKILDDFMEELNDEFNRNIYNILSFIKDIFDILYKHSMSEDYKKGIRDATKIINTGLETWIEQNTGDI